MSKARILAVDDQRYFRELIEGLLSEEGYEVQTASTGEEALHILEREDFDIVVTDLVMPGIDGSELVRRVKERLPEQDIIMVTGVVDVKTAVEAMKQGATDYILKPFDRKVLADSLNKILSARRLHDEHARLMAENLEFMGVLSLYERAAGLFSTLSLEPLAERLVEGLCLETHAQAGVLWTASEPGGKRMKMVGARGLIRVDEESEELSIDRLDHTFAPLVNHGRSIVRRLVRGDSEGEALYVPLRTGGQLVGIARLSDRLEGEPFGDPDRAAAEKFVSLGATAVANALRFRELERRSFRDPVTRAYTSAYFEDVVRNEIQKANRFGHPFSMIRLELDGLAEVRAETPESRFSHWLEILVGHIGSALRSTDLLATAGDSSYFVLMPQTDSLGGAVLGQRIRETLDRAGALEKLSGGGAHRLTLAAATFPTDGTQLDTLLHALDQRLAENRVSIVEALTGEDLPFAKLIESLSELSRPAPPEMAKQLTRFVLDDVARRPRDRGLLFVSAGSRLGPTVIEGLERIAEQSPRTEVIVVGDRPPHERDEDLHSWVTARAVGTSKPFLLYYGDGPAYAMVTGEGDSPDATRTPLFHTSDRALVEHLAFQLQRDLGIPTSV